MTKPANPPGKQTGKPSGPGRDFNPPRKTTPSTKPIAPPKRMPSKKG